jgi:ABC-type phosphate/phosphonate transport system substrate-binding protein
MKTRFLAFAFVLIAGSGALADDMILVYPGKPGTQAQAKNVLDSFTDYLETHTGWPKGNLHATYFNDEAPAAQALAAEHPPSWGILSLGVYLKWKKAGKAITLVAQSELEKKPTMQFHLLVPKDSKITDFKSISGANVASCYLEDREFATNIVFGGKLDTAKEIAVIDTKTMSSAFTACARFKPMKDGQRVDALLVDDEQLRGMEGKKEDFDKMRVVWSSDLFPTPPVVRFGAKDAAQQEKLLTVLKGMPGNAPGRKLLVDLTTTGFREPNASAYAALEKAY